MSKETTVLPTHLNLLVETIDAYKAYIDHHIGMSEQDRSDLLMLARDLDATCEAEGLYDSEFIV